MAHWRYDFEDTESGCRVTESFEDRRKPWFATVARVMGDHSSEHAEQEMDPDAGQPGHGRGVAARHDPPPSA